MANKKIQPKKAQKTTAAKEKGIVPLADRVLIKPLETKGEATTASGIILPGKESNEKHERGEVVAVGAGRISAEGKRIAIEVKKGDTVWFKRGYDADEVKVAGVELILVSEGNILAVEK
jgi:chaperonin GroES